MKKILYISLLIISVIVIFYCGMFYQECRPKPAQIGYEMFLEIQEKIEDFINKIGNDKKYVNCDYLLISITERLIIGNNPSSENNLIREIKLNIRLIPNDFHVNSISGILVECCPIAGKKVLINPKLGSFSVARINPYAGEYFRYALPKEYKKYLKDATQLDDKNDLASPVMPSEWSELIITLHQREIVDCVITNYKNSEGK